MPKAKTMYKLMHGRTCIMLAPLQPCFDRMKAEVGNATAADLRKNQWSIVPARRTPIWKALDELAQF